MLLLLSDQMLNDAIGARLRHRIVALRAERGFTQEELAGRCDIDKGFLSRIESGERMPSLEKLFVIARNLRVDVRDLFVFPEDGVVAQALERLRREPELARAVLDLPRVGPLETPKSKG
jgi:transcriptional regulator with XRE-family HTH domain